MIQVKVLHKVVEFKSHVSVLRTLKNWDIVTQRSKVCAMLHGNSSFRHTLRADKVGHMLWGSSSRDEVW